MKYGNHQKNGLSREVQYLGVRNILWDCVDANFIQLGKDKIHNKWDLVHNNTSVNNWKKLQQSVISHVVISLREKNVHVRMSLSKHRPARVSSFMQLLGIWN